MKRAFTMGTLVLVALVLPVGRAVAAAEQDTVSVDFETEGVIHGALQYLAKQQGINGSWTQNPGSASNPVAMTGYVLMAYLSTGNLPDEGEFGRNVTSGMQFLLNQIQPDGLFRGVGQGQYMYSHGIATLALAELYGQTKSPLLRQRLEQVLGVILGAQSTVGGWRYTPTARDADISVTVLQVAALRAAKNAGLAVPADRIERAIEFIRKCYNEGSGGFAYQPGGGPGFARTAAGIYSLQVCGKYDDPRVAKGSDYLFDNVDKNQEWWPYACYYAAPAQYMIGGDVWKRWYAEMKTKLLSTVSRDGDMNHWDNKGGGWLGPIYNTAVFITILAVPYHYIPLYQR